MLHNHPSNNLKIDSRPLIALTHIPKCAGSSFRESLIEPNIAPAEIYRPKSLKKLMVCRQDFRYLVGHWPAGVLNYLNPICPARKRPQLRVVILREPLEQLVSYFYFHRQLGASSPYGDRVKDCSIVEFYQENPQLACQQVYFVAGMLLGYPKSPGVALARFTPRVLLWRAKSALSAYFQYVTTAESSEADFPDFASRENLSYVPRRCEVTVTRERPKMDEIETSDLKRLRELSRLDQAVYDAGRRRRDEIFGT